MGKLPLNKCLLFSPKSCKNTTKPTLYTGYIAGKFKPVARLKNIFSSGLVTDIIYKLPSYCTTY
jgi:hypothetical protein